MSNWISITEDDLNDAKLVPLIAAFREKVLAVGQTDPLPRLTQTVLDRIRRKIASCARNQVDSDVTKIPKGLKDMAVDFIYAELAGRLQEPLTQDERDAMSRWTADLNRIAECKDVVEQPDDSIPADVQSTGGLPTISHCRRERQHRREGL